MRDRARLAARKDNRDLLTAMMRIGEPVEVPRLIEYRAVFTTRGRARDAATELRGRRFAVVDLAGRAGRRRVGFSRQDPVDAASVDRSHDEVWEIVRRHRGCNLEWGCILMAGRSADPWAVRNLLTISSEIDGMTRWHRQGDVTHSALMPDLAAAEEAANLLRGQGFRVEEDDFFDMGDGYYIEFTRGESPRPELVRELTREIWEVMDRFDGTYGTAR